VTELTAAIELHGRRSILTLRGQPFLLSPNQQFILWNLTGWQRKNGCRRFRRASITAGRKWGKSLAQFGLTPKSKRGLAAGEVVDPLDAL
jgi:phage terminase large subunit-like protein